MVRDYRVLQDNVLMSVRSDKRRHPPHGLLGGGSGAPSMNLINPGVCQQIVPTLVVDPITLEQGDLFRPIMAGGGGYGDTLERPVEAVLQDVIDGKITHGHAQAAYGVVLVQDTGPTVDRVATGQLRHRMRDLQRSMYEVRGRSLAQRAVMACAGAVCVAIAWWLLLGGGLHVVSGWVGARWQPG